MTREPAAFREIEQPHDFGPAWPDGHDPDSSGPCKCCTHPPTSTDGERIEGPCPCCGYGGWYGARWHNPTHFAPHVHCDCGRPCSACAKGDGFHRSKPW